ncbi:hypothetical protein CYMTET_32957 [Cymbomonas tetramitiformis]|uniref:J domain-containing protein n=1 Tax=Cymbomonas tetramitiformis TaxID=36881 RepID=A0AAE0KRP5_9CHLO|nr:hypothetical protein CYMTET_32957 [Cymbomonas tetramitiformis]
MDNSGQAPYKYDHFSDIFQTSAVKTPLKTSAPVSASPRSTSTFEVSQRTVSQQQKASGPPGASAVADGKDPAEEAAREVREHVSEWCSQAENDVASAKASVTAAQAKYDNARQKLADCETTVSGRLATVSELEKALTEAKKLAQEGIQLIWEHRKLLEDTESSLRSAQVGVKLKEAVSIRAQQAAERAHYDLQQTFYQPSVSSVNPINFGSSTSGGSPPRKPPPVVPPAGEQPEQSVHVGRNSSAEMKAQSKLEEDTQRMEAVRRSQREAQEQREALRRQTQSSTVQPPPPSTASARFKDLPSPTKAPPIPQTAPDASSTRRTSSCPRQRPPDPHEAQSLGARDGAKELLAQKLHNHAPAQHITRPHSAAVPQLEARKAKPRELCNRYCSHSCICKCIAGVLSALGLPELEDSKHMTSATCKTALKKAKIRFHPDKNRGTHAYSLEVSKTLSELVMRLEEVTLVSIQVRMAHDKGVSGAQTCSDPACGGPHLF